MGLTQDLAITSDNRYLYATNPGVNGTFVYDIQEIIKTIKEKSSQQLSDKPLEELNSAVGIAANFGDGSGASVLGIGASFGLGIASTRPLLNLIQPIQVINEETLTPTFQWNFAGITDDVLNICYNPTKEEEVKEVNLYVSVFPTGQGLLPKDRWPELKDIPTEDNRLINDYNPNRILTAKWTKSIVAASSEQGVWTWNGGSKIGSNDEFLLPDNLILTSGQDYYWAVEAVTDKGKKYIVENGEFETPLPEANNNETFTSITILTRGVEPTFGYKVDDQIEEMAEHIAGKDGAVLKYNATTGTWQQFGDKSSQRGQPLVLLADWIEAAPDQTKFYNAGFAEAAADTLFASLVQLDQRYANSVGDDNQGAIFDSRLNGTKKS